MEKIYTYWNWIMLGAVSLTVFLLLVAYFIGQSENKSFLEDQSKFEYAVQLLEQENAPLAASLFNELEENYSDNHLVIWQKGWALAQAGELNASLDYFLMAQDLNPVLTRQPTFLIQFSWLMLNTDRYEEAKVYLTHSKGQRGITEDQVELVNSWLELIEIELELEATEVS